MWWKVNVLEKISSGFLFISKNVSLMIFIIKIKENLNYNRKEWLMLNIRYTKYYKNRENITIINNYPNKSEENRNLCSINIKI